MEKTETIKGDMIGSLLFRHLLSFALQMKKGFLYFKKTFMFLFFSRGPAEADELARSTGYIYSGTYKWEDTYKST